MVKVIKQVARIKTRHNDKYYKQHICYSYDVLLRSGRNGKDCSSASAPNYTDFTAYNISRCKMGSTCIATLRTFQLDWILFELN
jgi:hypothetical protein